MIGNTNSLGISSIRQAPDPSDNSPDLIWGGVNSFRMWQQKPTILLQKLCSFPQSLQANYWTVDLPTDYTTIPTFEIHFIIRQYDTIQRCTVWDTSTVVKQKGQKVTIWLCPWMSFNHMGQWWYSSSALDACERSASRFDRLITTEESYGTGSTAVWVGSRAGLNALEKRIFFNLRKIGLWFL